MASRLEMNAALKAGVMPHLRSVGFSGSFPYLRRITDEGVDLVSFQFDRHGGAFTIEIAKCLPSGIEHPSLGHIPAVKAIAQHRHARYRKRLGHPSWFSFASSDAAAVAEAALKQLSDSMIWHEVSADGDEAPYAKR